jgi:elongation factor P
MTLTDTIKKGMYILYKDEPYYIKEAQFSRQGRVSAFTRTKLKNLLNGKVISVTFDSGQKVDEIDVRTKTMQYVYRDDEFAYIMDKDTYKQDQVPVESAEKMLKFVKEGEDVVVKFFEDKPISLEPRPTVELKVENTMDGAVKGNTSGNAMKKATLETGYEIDVPLFVKTGDKIQVNTSSGEYVGKA